MFIVFHSVLSSQPINGETFVLSLESIPHDLSHQKKPETENRSIRINDIIYNSYRTGMTIKINDIISNLYITGMPSNSY